MSDAAAETVLAGVATIEHARPVDVVLGGGRVVDVGPAGTLTAPEVIDGEGRLCIGAFVDAHCHLDKAFLAEDPGLAGTWGESFFEALRARKRTASLDEATTRMRRAVQQAALNGTGTMRAQIDVDDVVGLTHLDAALALRDECAPYLALQIVVFPQEGLAGNPAAREAVEAALARGADVMGGAHGFDRAVTNAEHLEACFELAVAHDVDLDLHVDFDATPDWPWDRWDIHHVARLTAAHGWQGRVTVAHLTQHGLLSADQRSELVTMLTDCGIGVVVVPGAELHAARAWQPDQPSERVQDATADWAELIRAGVPLAYAGGHLADAFHPHGQGDLLRDGLLLAAARNLGDPVIGGCHVLTMGTVHGAGAVGLDGPYGVVAGAPADLVVLDAPDATTALRHQADRWLVLHGGAVVATTRTERHLTGAAVRS